MALRPLALVACLPLALATVALAGPTVDVARREGLPGGGALARLQQHLAEGKLCLDPLRRDPLRRGLLWRGPGAGRCHSSAQRRTRL